jgi:hypothetical protein
MKLSTDKGTENKYWNSSLISLMAPQLTQLEKHLIIYKNFVTFALQVGLHNAT